MLNYTQLKTGIIDQLKVCFIGEKSPINSILKALHPSEYEDEWVDMQSEEIKKILEPILTSLGIGIANQIDLYVKGIEARIDIKTVGSPNSQSSWGGGGYKGPVGEEQKMAIPTAVMPIPGGGFTKIEFR